MTRGIYEILNQIAEQTTRTGKIDELRRHGDNTTLMLLLKMSFDKGLRWKLPEGAPPYTPAQDFDQQGMLYKEMKRLYLFLDDPRSANLKPARREQLFVELLEALHPKDAEVIVNVKEKKPLAKGLTEKLVREAFPTLLQ